MDSERWNKMSASEQILNIGGEVQRAVDRKEAGKKEESLKYFNLALDWIRLSKLDPKNHNRLEEFSVVENELIDYFSTNGFKNDRNSIMTYWNSYFSAVI